MCPMVWRKNVKKKPLTLKINLSHAICNSKNEDSSCYLYVKFFFYIFAMSHHRTQSSFYLSTTHICICIYIYIYMYIYICVCVCVPFYIFLASFVCSTFLQYWLYSYIYFTVWPVNMNVTLTSSVQGQDLLPLRTWCAIPRPASVDSIIHLWPVMSILHL